MDGKAGTHAGVKPVNMPWAVFLACYDGERIDTNLYARLNRDVSLDEMYDILEMREVADSWRHAYHLNNPRRES